MDWSPYYKALLALVAWREAGGEGRDGQRAVCHVIRNRVRAGWGDWAEVICQKNQFTSISYKGDPQTVEWPMQPDPAFEEAIRIAELNYSGGDFDLTKGALYYANLKHIDKGGWFEKEILGKPKTHPQTTQVGAHSFYK